ncbi:hypothetical protein [Chamaesiphon sp. OTE_8_metabat_110]|uniref:hypothetical protein n=1 Tax=Chamaesiphon sp. OTE_8_metabat_110 TaxID=2964696 RepID=UPI00286A3B2B|nr:hypothetical protein [Chamaesiphon sp. OTE_8_metabat_110]
MSDKSLAVSPLAAILTAFMPMADNRFVMIMSCANRFLSPLVSMLPRHSPKLVSIETNYVQTTSDGDAVTAEISAPDINVIYLRAIQAPRK